MSDDLKLTGRQQQILDFIKNEIKIRGYPPSVREIGRAIGLKSSSTVHSYILQLEKKGFLRRDPSKPRAIIPIDSDAPDIAVKTVLLPLVGSVAAGTPIFAEQNIDDYVPVPVEFIGHGNHFILKVKGESMVEAGILDGDYLIVKQQADAANGEIVVALLGDEATVKRYYRRNGYIELKPENSSMDSIKVENVQVVGKVSGLMRRI
ncbi:MAG: transcriptional repressor LexA [Syntrophomonadaceae bacterium]|nr:transcriptional repressor LexA [Syntrophomonadaceae bacterium]